MSFLCRGVWFSPNKKALKLKTGKTYHKMGKGEKGERRKRRKGGGVKALI